VATVSWRDTVEWIDRNIFIILSLRSKKRTVTLRLDEDIVAKYDRLVAELLARRPDLKLTRTEIMRAILTKAVEKPELIVQMLS
jgi:hypothetical protein